MPYSPETLLSGVRRLVRPEDVLHYRRTFALPDEFRHSDEDRVLLLLPGQRSHGRIIMFHEMDVGVYTLPTNLIADNHLWEVRE